MAEEKKALETTIQSLEQDKGSPGEGHSSTLLSLRVQLGEVSARLGADQPQETSGGRAPVQKDVVASTPAKGKSFNLMSFMSPRT
jgi:hypothetical protein